MVEQGKEPGGSPPKRIRSVERALTVLCALSDSQRPLGVSAIAERTGLPKSSVFLCLRTMMDAGFVDQDPETERYQLGLQAARIGVTAIERSTLSTYLAPAMRRLAERSGEAVSLAILLDREALIVERFESAYVLNVTIRIGTRMPLHASASGKCLLAGMTDDEIRVMLQGTPALPATASNTVRSVDSLLEEIRKVRERGFAFNLDEFVDGVSAAAVPVWSNGRVMCALSIAGPTVRFEPTGWVDDLLRIAGSNAAPSCSDGQVADRRSR